MKDTLRARLESLCARLEELNVLLAAEDATRDLDQFRKLSREYAELTGVVALYTRYRQAEHDAAAAREIAAEARADITVIGRPRPLADLDTAALRIAVAQTCQGTCAPSVRRQIISIATFPKGQVAMPAEAAQLIKGEFGLRRRQLKLRRCLHG